MYFKSLLALTTLFFSLMTFSKDIIWNNEDIHLKNYSCEKGDRLIIENNVFLVHPEDIKIKCDDIHFRKNSTLTSKSNLFIQANSASGEIKIIGTRGANNKIAHNGTHGENSTPNGSNGSEGPRGRDAYTRISFFDFGCFSAGGGGKGGRGSDAPNPGQNGSNGKKGIQGRNGVDIVFIVKNLKDWQDPQTGEKRKTKVYLESLGENGGKGGNGGNGAPGGHGGQGGRGGRGGNGNGCKGGAGGGPGGDGGHGSGGGKGGDAGDGGNGGLGGNVRMYKIDTNFENNREEQPEWTTIKVEGGISGAPGLPGKAGIGGQGGHAGYGGYGGSGSGGPIWRTSGGHTGNTGGGPGQNGQNGKEGNSGYKGQPGKNGSFKFLKLPSSIAKGMAEHKIEDLLNLESMNLFSKIELLKGNPSNILKILKNSSVELLSSKGIKRSLPLKGLTPHLKMTIDWSHECNDSSKVSVYLVNPEKDKKFFIHTLTPVFTDYSIDLAHHFKNKDLLSISIDQYSIDISSLLFFIKEKDPHCKITSTNAYLGFDPTIMANDLKILEITAANRHELLIQHYISHGDYLNGQKGALCSTYQLAKTLKEVELLTESDSWEDLSQVSKDAIVVGLEKATTLGGLSRSEIPLNDYWKYFLSDSYTSKIMACDENKSTNYEVSKDIFLVDGHINGEAYDNAENYFRVKENLLNVLNGGWSLIQAGNFETDQYKELDWLINPSITFHTKTSKE